MQQFVVPQFIDVEDKIIGPITVRQFLILLSGGLIVFIAYRLADFALFVAILAVVGGLALIFSFVKVNGQNFHYVLLNVLQYFKRPKLRVWKKIYSDQELKEIQKREEEAMTLPPPAVRPEPVKRTRINELALIVNTGGYYRGEDV